MPSLFSKWSVKSHKQPRIKQGISSTDVNAGHEDARQLTDNAEVDQYVEAKAQSEAPQAAAPVHQSNAYTTSASNGPDVSAWRVVTSQQLVSNPLSEFGAGPSVQQAAQRASTGKPSRRSSNERRAPYSASTIGSQPSKAMKRPVLPENGNTAAISQPPSYGYTTYGWDTQMDVTRATEIILACGQQIRARGLDSPLIFSSMALDLSSHSVTSLLKSLVQTPAAFLSSDVKFANPHDLAAVIKWTLSRLGKVVPVSVYSHDTSRKGDPSVEETVLVQQRGFLEWESYLRWRTHEKTNGYQLAAFGTFSDSLSSSSLALLVAILSLLSSTTSYSPKNGMTPSRLARHFGVLLFGLPEDETFEQTYKAFVRAGNAAEHLLLAYIRNCSTTEAIPTRLADHIKGYPAMLSADFDQPGPSVRGVPLTHVNRTVRLYSLDLIETACEMDVVELSSEWKACCSTSDSIGKDPQFSDRFRKLINLRGGSKQGRGQKDQKESDETEAYGSLVDKKWGDFMNEGFSAPDQSKLAFDLKESERKARKQRPDSVQWDTFEKSGFVLKDDGLASVLSFDDTLRDEMERWPAERAELMEKLRKTNKMMPAFPYDTTPYIVSSPTLDNSPNGQWATKPVSRIDEVFAEVYADVLLGNGWSNRDEQTHRNANFVVVQYKSRPTLSTVGSQAAGSSRQVTGYVAQADDRTDAAWLVVEEIVPAKYRSEMEASGRVKGRSLPGLRKLSLFKKRKEEKKTQATAPPASTSSFDELFRPGLGGLTKRVQLNKDPTSNTATALSRKDSGSTIRQHTNADADSSNSAPGRKKSIRKSQLITTFKNNSTFGSKSVRKRTQPEEEMPPLPPPKQQQSGLTTSPSFRSEDFETRSLHDPESDAFAQDRSGKHSFLKGNKGKRMSKDDTWLDVMIKANGFRMAGQDATMSSSRGQAAERSVTPTAGLLSIPAHDSSESFHSMTPTAPLEAQAPVDDSPELGGASNEEEFAQEDDAASQVSRQSLHAAGWTVEGESSDAAPATPPKRVAPSPITDSSPLMEQVLTANAPQTAEDAPSPPSDKNAKLSHLLSLPLRKGDSEDRDKAREERIQAAKNRAKELRANLNPTTKQELDSRREAKASASTSGDMSTPKNDPFSKNRISGRVASVASKFGGGGSAAAATVKPVSPNPGTSSFTDKQLPPVADQDRTEEYSTGDVDSIYPEDAASNFSRDTNLDEDVNIRSSSMRPGGSIAAANTQYFDQSLDESRTEDEDQHTTEMPSFRVPYQPGMPLSNLEEESESVLSGSNL